MLLTHWHCDGSLGSRSSQGATPSVTIVGAWLFATPGNVPEEAEVQSLWSPSLGKTASGLGPDATTGWIPTAPVTPVEGMAAAEGVLSTSPPS